MVGYGSVKCACAITVAVVICLDSTDKVSTVVESDVVVQDTFILVLPLVNPSKKITISNASCPFIKSDTLAKDYCYHGMCLRFKWCLSGGNLLCFHMLCVTADILYMQHPAYMVLKDNANNLYSPNQ